MDLDHFIPWSFVAHDLMWNLVPANPSINSSKGNHLPALEKHLFPFAKCQHMGLKIIQKIAPDNKQLEDYLQLGAGISELCQLSDDKFAEVYRRALVPLYQIAENMGFSRWCG